MLDLQQRRNDAQTERVALWNRYGQNMPLADSERYAQLSAEFSLLDAEWQYLMLTRPWEKGR